MAKARDLADLLHPSRFPNASGKMMALVAYVLGERWTTPSIGEIEITSDGHVMASHEGDVGMNEMIGSMEDLRNNWRRLLRAAGLTEAERKDAEKLFRRSITKYGDPRWVRENPSARMSRAYFETAMGPSQGDKVFDVVDVRHGGDSRSSRREFVGHVQTVFGPTRSGPGSWLVSLVDSGLSRSKFAAVSLAKKKGEWIALRWVPRAGADVEVRSVRNNPTPGVSVVSISEIKAATKGHWFSPDTMRFFGSRPDKHGYVGPGGTFFASKERPWGTEGFSDYGVYELTKDGDVGSCLDVENRQPTLAIARSLRKRVNGVLMEANPGWRQKKAT